MPSLLNAATSVQVILPALFSLPFPHTIFRGRHPQATLGEPLTSQSVYLHAEIVPS